MGQWVRLHSIAQIHLLNTNSLCETNTLWRLTNLKLPSQVHLSGKFVSFADSEDSDAMTVSGHCQRQIEATVGFRLCFIVNSIYDGGAWERIMFGFDEQL